MITLYAEEKPADLTLYSNAAVLLDADSGRVLYEKNADIPMAMASTTKIMTCIVVLENVENLSEMVTISPYAATMPKVKLYIKAGEQYQVRNLLFSLMLESHNDSAVALAEYVGKQQLTELMDKDTSQFTSEESKKAVKAFANLMNAKAREIGCKDTYFITPNGLDATEVFTGNDGESVTMEHHTTAAELARIMTYCIKESSKRDLFLEITRMPAYSFTENNRIFRCNNHNAFLSMMDGALSGKTGFTNKAGYCYVGALERDGRTYIVALLACGWPNHKSYKWSDTRKLMEYGLENYVYHEYCPEIRLQNILVENGVIPDGSPYDEKYVTISGDGLEEPLRLLTTKEERVIVKVKQAASCEAPIKKGQKAGYAAYYLRESDGDEIFLKEIPLYITEDVKKLDFGYTVRYLWSKFCPVCKKK